MRCSVQGNSQPAARGETTREVQQALVDYLSGRPDVGLDKTLLNLALEPPNPFDPGGRRNFRKGFVLAMFVALGLAGTFVYFNFLAGGQ
jgi:hypothetical protein